MKKFQFHLPGVVLLNVFFIVFFLGVAGYEPAAAQVSETDKVNTVIDKKQLTLRDAIKTAFRNSPDVAIMDARVRQADAMLKQSRAAFYPALSFYTEYIKGDAPSSYLFKAIDQRQLPMNTNFNDPGSFDNFESGVSAKMNLFSGGKNYLGQKIAAQGASAARLGQLDMKNSITASVTRVFYSCLAAGEYIKISRQSVKTVEEQLRVMKVKFETGGALKSDVLSLEVRLAQAKEDVVKSHNNYEQSRAGLSMILGVDPNTEFGLRESRLLTINAPDTCEDGFLFAMKNRQDLKMMCIRVKQAEMAIDVEKGNFLPEIFLQGKYYLDDSDFKYDNKRENWNVGVLFNWDAFTGFFSEAALAKARASLEESRAARKKAILSAKMDVKIAYLNLEAAKARLEVADRSVSMAEESLKLVKKQFDGGTVTVTRYLETELALNHARINKVSAHYDREKSYAEIGRSLGILKNSQ